MKQVYTAVINLTDQVKGMKRKMDSMQLSLTERETDIVQLHMSIGDERHKVVRGMDDEVVCS